VVVDSRQENLPGRFGNYSGYILSVAVIPGSSPRTAVGVNGDGRREVLGLAIGTSEAETFWTDFLRKLPGGVCAASSSSSRMPTKG
jgi:hypothetical protein